MAHPTTSYLLRKNSFIFAVGLMFLFVCTIPFLNAIQSDGSYSSPTSDKSYSAPKSDQGYTAPKSDNGYTSTKIGPGYQQVKSDNNFTGPSSDNKYQTPTSAPGYMAPTTGEGYIAPNILNITLLTDFQQLSDPLPINITSNTTNQLDNGTALNNGESSTNNSQNTTPENQSTNTTKNRRIDTRLIGQWKIYSQSIYYQNGDFEFVSPSLSSLNLQADGSWTYENTHGTWEIASINDEDWTKWGIKKDFKTKLILYGWQGNDAEGPIEETSYGAQYLWAVYNLVPPIVTTDAQVWIKFSPAPNLNPQLTPEHDNIFSEQNLIGKWKIHSLGAHIDEQGNWVNDFATTTILELKKDKTWEFGTSRGTWEVLSIENEDWERWEIEPYAPTKRLVLHNWNGGEGDGPIETSSGTVSFFWVIYPARTKDNNQIQLQKKFAPLPSEKSSLTLEKKGSGIITSSRPNLNCGDQCSTELDSTAQITIEAIPSTGWTFQLWEGACEGQVSSCTLTLERSKTAKAIFAPGCTSNRECRNDESCQNAACVPVTCSCGTVNDHNCKKYECCVDTDCNPSDNENNNVCDTNLNKCVAISACQPVVITGSPDQKHDIVFISDDINDPEMLIKGIGILMDYKGIFDGVFSTSPFKEHKEDFNLWMTFASDYSFVNGEPDPSDYLRFVQTCEYDTVVVLSRKTFRPFALFPSDGPKGGSVYLSLGFLTLRSPEFAAQNSGRLLLHELGHAIGGLADEYVEYGAGSRNLDIVVNCAPDLETAKKRWGDLVGTNGVNYYTGIQSVPGTIYYKHPGATFSELGLFPDGSDWGDGGCSYDWKNIRPTINSLMNNQFVEGIGYGPVNERQLRKSLEVYQ